MSARARLVPVLPTALTLANLMCGFVAIAKAADAMQWAGDEGTFDAAFSQRIVHGCLLVLAAMIFDALDGRVARLTGQTSPFGAMLDSLSDVVTFGVAPAFLAKVAYEHTVRSMDIPFRSTWITLLCALYVMGAALRLARFTVAAPQGPGKHETFSGLPSPSAAATIVTAAYFIFEGRHEIGLSASAADTLGTWMLRGLPGLAAVLGFLMVSRVTYVHLLQRYIVPRMRPRNLIKLFLVLWLVLFFHSWSLLLLSLIYVVGGLILGLVAHWRGRSVTDELPDPWDIDEEEPVSPA